MEQPIYKSVPITDTLELVEDFHYDRFGVSFTIPKGFQWDGASIPRLFWLTTGSNYDPKFTKAGLLHDWMYAKGHIARGLADKVFLRELKSSGVNWYTRNKMYAAVRVFGAKHYNNRGKQ